MSLKVLACIPVDVETFYREWCEGVTPRSMWPKPYADSTKTNCKLCRQEVWIGPRQQMALTHFRDQMENAIVVCFPCTIRHSKGEQVRIKSLGGEHDA